MKNFFKLLKENFTSGGPIPHTLTLEGFFDQAPVLKGGDPETLEAMFKGAEDRADFTFSSEIVKMNEEQHLVYGWAYVCEEGGQEVIDHSGDVIEPDELAKAAHEFIMNYRKAKAMHNGAAIGEFVESIVFTKDVQAALGINLNKTGWFVGLKVHDQDVWKRFKSGEYAMFSIGGFGEKILEDET